MKRLLLTITFFLSLICIAQDEFNFERAFNRLKLEGDQNKRIRIIVSIDSALGEVPTVEEYKIKARKFQNLLKDKVPGERYNKIIVDYNLAVNDENDYPKGEKILLNEVSYFEGLKEEYQSYTILLYNHLSYHYTTLSNYVLSNSYAFKCLDYYEKHPDLESKSSIYNSIAFNYLGYNSYDDAEAYFLKSYNIGVELNDLDIKSAAKINLGSVYEESGEYDKAKETYYESLVLHKEWGDPTYIGYSYVLIGSVYERLNQYDSCKVFLDSAKAILEEPFDPYGMAFYHISMARMLSFFGEYEKANKEIEKALECANQASFYDNILNGLEIKHDLDFRLGNYKDAYRNIKSFYKLRDSLFNPHVSKEIAGLEYKFEYDSKRWKDSLQHQEEQRLTDLKHEEEVRRYWIYLVSGLAIGALLLVLVFYAIRQSRLRRKKNDELKLLNHAILEQKDLVEEKNKEILDSINYAKRIQSAILPPTKLVKSYLYNSFILYKPKDIVAGDFYWMETVTSSKKQATGNTAHDTILFAVADCTGHGVPGAMVSVICNNGLNRSVREHGLVDTGEILDKTKEIVIQEFEKSEDEVKDGMDIAIVRMEIKSEAAIEKEGVKIQYSGAHNPLWIIRKDSTEIEVIKANKQPIGKFRVSEKFDSHDLTLYKGDTIYLFSDGYADQFGGEKGKKMKSKAFKEKLLSIQKSNLEAQKQELDRTFEEWKGDLEQIDDICVIGVRI